LPLIHEPRNRLIAYKSTLVKVDLEDIGAMFGKGKDRIVVQLVTVVQFEL
jgi:hypothetical protein